MLTLYLVIKVLHVFAAIVAVGTNITYGVWIGRAQRDPGTLPFALRGVDSSTTGSRIPVTGFSCSPGSRWSACRRCPSRRRGF